MFYNKKGCYTAYHPNHPDDVESELNADKPRAQEHMDSEGTATRQLTLTPSQTAADGSGSE